MSRPRWGDLASRSLRRPPLWVLLGVLSCLPLSPGPAAPAGEPDEPARFFAVPAGAPRLRAIPAAPPSSSTQALPSGRTLEPQARGWASAAAKAFQPAAQREAPPGERLRFDADIEGTLAASIFSLPAAFFTLEEAAAFLAAVRGLAPDRELLVLTDLPLGSSTSAVTSKGEAPRADPSRVHLLPVGDSRYTPWPRDPFSLVRGEGGRVVVLLRPNLQPGREADAGLGLELAGKLPRRLDAAWGGVRWRRAAVPFHNGQVLLAPAAAWVSLHTLEPRALQILGIERVPVASFATAAGIDRYLAAAERARGELAGLYGRPVRLVHPLPTTGPEAERAALMQGIGGGAGYDLDSLVTLLPAGAGTTRALVADLAAGRELLRRLPAADLEALRRGYDLGPGTGRLPALLTAAQETPRARRLAGYLDLVAESLRSEGMEVGRLPLLSIPVSLLREPGKLEGEFLLGWNNVVVEVRGGRVRAEGFSSLLPAGDAAARDAFARAGSTLDLVPPLVESVVRNGGYRCASNHLREPSGSSPRGERSPR